MTDLIRIFTERGDLAHLALFLWATSASALAWFALRELTSASRRFDNFVRELVRFNEHFGGNDGYLAQRAALDPRRDQKPARSSRHIPRISRPPRSRRAAKAVHISSGDQAMATNMCNMLKVAERSIVKMYPTFDLKEFKQVITENGNLWELTYEMPSNMLCGVPIVTIDKRACKVVRIVHT